MKQITKILGILAIAIIIFAGKLFFLPNSIAKTKDNISRVESSDNYSITFNELVSLLEETAKKEKIEVNESLIKNFRRYAALLNNVLNSDKNQKEVLEFLTKQTGKKIAPARKNIDNFSVSLSVSGKSLVVTFRPQ